MIHDWRTRFLFIALIVAAPVAAPCRARADTPAAQADTLFRRALVLMKEGKYAEACPKLEKSQELDPGAGTQFRLAECYEKVGRLAAALSLFKETVAAAKAAGRNDREEQSQERVKELLPRVPTLRVVISTETAAIEGLTITLDGAPVDRGRLTGALPIDPGDHSVAATAPGKKPWDKRITAAEGASIEVIVPDLGETGDADDRPNDNAGPSKIILAIGAGLGAAALGGAIATTVLSSNKAAAADDLNAAQSAKLNDKNWCAVTPRPGACGELTSLNEQSDTLRSIAIAGYVAAGVFGAATIAYGLWPREGRAEQRARVLPWIGPSVAGVSLESSF